MCNTLIATWRMALEGVVEARNETDLHQAVIRAVMNVEDNPLYHSVGYGGLPNIDGEVELDAAFMDGDSLNYGAVGAVKYLKNPILAAHALSRYQRSNVLTGEGALVFAINNGLALRDNRYPLSQRKWQAALQQQIDTQRQEAYDGHDTVCVLGASPSGAVCAGVSTSGLFLKKAGRLGDSPLIGSGCYADSVFGAAAATGVGEDIMKGCLSWEIVRKMAMYSPQVACENVVRQHTQTLKSRKGECGSISVIAMNPAGEWGAATNKAEFSFIVAQPGKEAVVWLAHGDQTKHSLEKASAQWLADYLARLSSGSGN
jgi:N4-(beta-N-acetylglucosaminyl)-L-asparaginase